jgi:hypothetical protein
VRAGVLLWSTLSGLILGVFIDATLIGVALLLSAVVPRLGARFGQRWFMVVAILTLVAIPIGSAVLGFLEGRLKAS